MKRILVLFLAFSTLALTANAQFDKSFVAKWAPAGLAVGKITIGGEYNFKKKQSVTLLVGIPASRSYSLDYDGNTSAISSEAFSLMAGYRYYFGKRAIPAGFYIEPYVKYLKHETNGFLYGEIEDEEVEFDSRSELKVFGVGAQLGVQFLIAKKVSIDLFILGPEANSVEFLSSAREISNLIPWTSSEAAEAEEDIQDVLEDIPFIGNKIEVDVNQVTKTVTTKYDGFAPGFRFGISFGFRF